MPSSVYLWAAVISNPLYQRDRDQRVQEHGGPARWEAWCPRPGVPGLPLSPPPSSCHPPLRASHQLRGNLLAAWFQRMRSLCAPNSEAGASFPQIHTLFSGIRQTRKYLDIAHRAFSLPVSPTAVFEIFGSVSHIDITILSWLHLLVSSSFSCEIGRGNNI